MNLTAALNAALSSIAARSMQTSVTADNIANVDNANYVRRETQTTSLPEGGISRVDVRRAQNRSLLMQFLRVTSDTTESRAMVEGLDRLKQIIGDPELEMSPAALMAKLKNALQTYSALPHDQVVAGNAVQTASDLANSLNEGSVRIQQTRAKADSDIQTSVDRINLLLSQFDTANKAIVRGTGSPQELASYLDTRDGTLASLSEELDITTMTRQNNDIAIYTKSGVVLYEKKPRNVTFVSTGVFSASTTGNQVFADGARITGGNSTMGIGSGRLKGLVDLRDNVSLTFQNQLDEIARGLIEAFAEKDQNVVPSLPDAAGLFTYAGGGGIPPSGALVVGLAGQIEININVDPKRGGNVNLLRDGAISDPGNPAYSYNTSGAAGFSDRINELFASFDKVRSFDPTAKVGTNMTLLDLAENSSSWFESTRKTTGDEADYRSTLLGRSSQSLSESTGVNLDNEMAIMMELERSFEASARLFATIDSMFSSLLSAVR